MKFLIDNFGECNLFGRENYEFYARITGRILKIEDNYIVSFWYPPDAIGTRKYSFNLGVAATVCFYSVFPPFQWFLRCFVPGN